MHGCGKYKRTKLEMDDRQGKRGMKKITEIALITGLFILNSFKYDYIGNGWNLARGKSGKQMISRVRSLHIYIL